MSEPMSVDEALLVADQVSPLPQVAHRALQALKAEVLMRWEQRTALSFRLQDLRAAVVQAGIADTDPLYLALHDTTATAEGWMHPGTLSDAAKDHLARLKRELASARGAPHYEEDKRGIAGFDASVKAGEPDLVRLGPAGFYAGFPLITDPTLAPNEVAFVDGNKRTVFKLDLEKETATLVREESLP